jgi:hypothetical protein
VSARLATIGERGRRFVLEVPLETPDGFGGIIRTFQPGPQLWGAIELLSQGERSVAAHVEAAVTHRVTLRWRRRCRALDAAPARAAPFPHPGRERSGRTPALADAACRGDRVVTSPALALRAALRACCLTDAPLAALMGGAAKVYDEPPRGDAPVYAVFGPAELRDWSTSSDRGHEQFASLVVWAKPGSAASALAAAERMAALVHDADLALAGHRLVSLTVSAIEIDRDPETKLARATLKLRAVTEATG